jgi:hypothetical protein
MLTVHAVDFAVGEWVGHAHQFMERFIDSEGSHKIKKGVWISDVKKKYRDYFSIACVSFIR